MSKLQQSDLILAGRYVDGELPAHEIAAAESRIASDPEFSAVVEQIRQQSAVFELLPNFKPSDDLADRTLAASMDQVKAIMGAWPIEQDDAKVTPASELPASRSDWKSTAALVASLAGVVLFGMILWQNNNPSKDSSFAMSPSAEINTELAHETGELVEAESDFNSKAGPAAPSLANRAPEMVTPKGGFASPSLQQSVSREQRFAAGMGMGGISGTPMKQVLPNSIHQSNDFQAAFNDLTPVSQVWCVNQNSAMPDNVVCDILQSNEITVQLDKRNALQSDAVQAYFVAATPRQMKLALSEISNSADIEMFELPQSSGSPIADAIQQQFKQSTEAQQQVESDVAVDPDMPQQLALAKSNALAQQLPLNSVRRIMPPANPPPIPNPDSLKEGLATKSAMKADALPLAATPNAKSAAPQRSRGDSTQQRSPEKRGSDEATTVAVEKKSGQLDAFLDESDQQLRKYLIFILGGEKQDADRTK